MFHIFFVSDVEIATEELLPISGHSDQQLQEALIEAQIDSPKKEDSPEPIVEEDVKDDPVDDSFVEVAKEAVEAFSDPVDNLPQVLLFLYLNMII